MSSNGHNSINCPLPSVVSKSPDIGLNGPCSPLYPGYSGVNITQGHILGRMSGVKDYSSPHWEAELPGSRASACLALTAFCSGLCKDGGIVTMERQ